MKRGSRVRFAGFSFLLVCLALLARPIAARQALPAEPSIKPRTLSELQARIAGLLDQAQFAGMRWGARILNDQGKTLFERDADQSFTPASNVKLYTTAAVLDALGTDFKIRTSVYATGPVSRAGVVSGDLVFYGRGDPNLSARFDDNNPDPYGDFYPAERIPAIEQLADQVKAAGIRRITGSVIGDDSYFAGERLGVGWEWDDLQFYYAAEVSALTVNDNVITYVVTPGRVAGEHPVIKTKPATSFPMIVNRAVTSSSGETRIGVHRQLDSNEVEFFGRIPVGAAPFQVHIAVHDPARFAATLLRESLERRNIRVQSGASSWNAIRRVNEPFDSTKLSEVAHVASKPLALLLKVVNKPSQNLHAELLLRQLASSNGSHETDNYGRPKPALEGANDARMSFLQKAGIDVTGLSLRDGSGLARSSLVSPRATSRLLEFMLAHPHFPVFADSLPVAGRDGTLKSRMKDTPAEGNVRAKTGTLTYVNSMSGYLTTAMGQVLIFSFYANNYTNSARNVTAVMDQICSLLAAYEEELE